MAGELIQSIISHIIPFILETRVVIPARFAPLLFSILMSIYMVTAMTFVVTWVNTGLDDGFILRWMRSFSVAFPIAFALTWLGAPYIQRFVAKRIKK